LFQFIDVYSRLGTSYGNSYSDTPQHKAVYEHLDIKPSLGFVSPTPATSPFTLPCAPLGGNMPQVGISPNAQSSPAPQFTFQDTEQLTHVGGNRLSEQCTSGNEKIWINEFAANFGSKTIKKIKEEVDMKMWSYHQGNPTASQEQIGKQFGVHQR